MVGKLIEKWKQLLITRDSFLIEKVILVITGNQQAVKCTPVTEHGSTEILTNPHQVKHWLFPNPSNQTSWLEA